MGSSNAPARVPPGFRFHPTDEELVDYYLKKKVECQRIDLDVIREIDLYKIEPWDLQEKCRIGSTDQDEWYFFSHKDKKYPTGTRTNRATTAGFWKATGRDKSIYNKHKLVGMRKTLVFYRGRAPNGQKTDWIMHEYRLESSEANTGYNVGGISHTNEEGWAVCRVFKKRSPNIKALLHDRETMMGGFCSFDDQMFNLLCEGLESPKGNAHMNASVAPMMMPSSNLFAQHTQQQRTNSLTQHRSLHGFYQQPDHLLASSSMDAMGYFSLGSQKINQNVHGSYDHTAAGMLGGSQFTCKKELEHFIEHPSNHDGFMHLPALESHKLTIGEAGSATLARDALSSISHLKMLMKLENHSSTPLVLHSAVAPLNSISNGATTIVSKSIPDSNAVVGSKEVEHTTDWRILDRLVASQLSQDAASTSDPTYFMNTTSSSPQPYTCSSTSVTDEDRQSVTLSDLSKKHQTKEPSSPSHTTLTAFNSKSDIELWNFPKDELAADKV
ncbi:hypothetical protein KP509_12G091600 [Ceratopteris richardii]|uniref:NAC domain-containing protein n=1 Tax=Ceratopteris richardii TaxID=49495 RepID=A0A8T2TN35_CERRI|nr:hypothetical protein KP509_12G091600 [Ceratopteris richardii]